MSVTGLSDSLTSHIDSGGRLAIVKAPPGSGKTHLLLQLAHHAFTRGMRVAIGAQTNAQADDICSRLARNYPGTSIVRFASKTALPVALGPSVVWTTENRQLPVGPAVVVATVAKWGLVDLTSPFDLFLVDEAWQMAWADFMLTGQVSERFLLIGDPGQIPPVVTIPVGRWETSPRAPHLPAPELILSDPGLSAVEAQIEVCRRLPHDTIGFVRPFYDFDFEPDARPGDRYVKVNGGRGNAHDLDSALERLGEASISAVTVATDPDGPPFEVDATIAGVAADLIRRLLDRGAVAADGQDEADIAPPDIGVVSTHRVMNGAIQDALGRLREVVRVDTAERWQGLERKVMVVVHPLSGVASARGFDLSTGRLCVMASRHRAGMLLLSRDHVPRTLDSYIPQAEQAVGRPDVVGRGHADHVIFWERLVAEDRVLALSA
jgi:hypothetical protein